MHWVIGDIHGMLHPLKRLLRAINDTVELATCWTLLAERLERAGQRERARAARNCAEALSYESGIASMRSA